MQKSDGKGGHGGNGERPSPIRAKELQQETVREDNIVNMRQ